MIDEEGRHFIIIIFLVVCLFTIPFMFIQQEEPPLECARYYSDEFGELDCSEWDIWARHNINGLCRRIDKNILINIQDPNRYCVEWIA